MQNNLDHVTEMVKDLREIAKTLLESSGLTEHELEMKLQSPESSSLNEFLKEYRAKLALSMQKAGEEEVHELLKKEEKQVRALLHTWLSVK